MASRCTGQDGRAGIAQFSRSHAVACDFGKLRLQKQTALSDELSLPVFVADARCPRQTLERRIIV